MSTIKIAITNLKSGSGKTALALNLAAVLATTGKQVLLVEGDPEGAYDDMMGLSDSGLVLDRKATQIMRSSPVSGLSVLCGFGRSVINPDSGHSEDKFQRIAKEHDYVIFDCPSVDGDAHREILRLTEHVLVPLQYDAESYDRLLDTLRVLTEVKKENKRLNLLGFPLTMIPSENVAMGESIITGDTAFSPTAKNTFSAIVKQYSGLEFRVTVPMDRTIAASREELLPVITKAPSSMAATMFHRLAEDVESRFGMVRRPIAPKAVAAPVPESARSYVDAPSRGSASASPYAAPASVRQTSGGPLTAMLGWITGLFGRR